jgi:hypothetical protein
VKLSWTADLQEFQYTRPQMEKIHISIQALQNMVRDTENALLQAFANLLPSTFDPAAVDQLPWDTLHDDGGKRESFIDAKDTWDKWLGPAVTALKQAYLDRSETCHRLTVDSEDGRPSFGAFSELLELDTKFQEVLAGALVSSTGVSPHVVTLRDYRFREDGEGLRNLFMVLESVVLEGGKQKGESRRDGRHEMVVRALTPRAGFCLVQYLALVRLALVEIMVDNHWHSNVIGTYKTHLFARPANKKEETGLWKPFQITAAWHVASAPYLKAKTSIVNVRQYGTGIYDNHFATLLLDQAQSTEPNVLNAVDRQGDHKKETRCNHYGCSDALCNGQSEPDMQDFILASRVWQSAMRAYPVDKSWPDSIINSVLLNNGQHKMLAAQVARFCIAQDLQLGRLKPQDIQTRVQSVCRDLPFLFKQEVSAWSSFRL